MLAGCVERTAAAPASEAAPTDFESSVRPLFASNGCFTLRAADGTLFKTELERCAKPRRPYSTFKIANALIAVEAGVLATSDSPLAWNEAAFPPQSWWPDGWAKSHTLASGMAVSAVPHFRTLAATLGPARMRAGLERLRYGSCASSCDPGALEPLDSFWLTGTFRASADDQLSLVDRLARKELDVKPATYEAVRTSLLREERSGKKLFAKTGTGAREDISGPDFTEDAPHLAWLVGWVEDGDAVHSFAAWIEGDDVEGAQAQRALAIRGALARLDLFPLPV